MIDKEKYGFLPPFVQTIIAIIQLDKWVNGNWKGTRHTSITQIERIMCQLIDNVNVPSIEEIANELVSVDVLIKRDLTGFAEKISTPMYRLNYDITADKIKQNVVKQFPDSESALKIKKQGGSDNDK